MDGGRSNNKEGYTEDDVRLEEICRNEIEECNKALANCICKVIADKVVAEIGYNLL